MFKGTKVQGQYKGITFTGTVQLMDKEDYGVILDRPILVEGVSRSKILVPVVPWKRAEKPTWLRAV